MYRKLLDGLLNNLTSANSSDWVDLMNLPEKALGWSENDESRLSTALNEFYEDGIDDERENYSNSEELESFHSSLSKLSKKTSRDLSGFLGTLKMAIAEAQEEESSESNSLESGDDDYRGSSQVIREEHITDDDIRQMFLTLEDG
jgi:hypothetical protein